MAIYKQIDFVDGANGLEDLNNFKNMIDSLREEISLYSVKLLIKLEGEAPRVIAQQLNEYYDDLKTKSDRINSVYSLKSTNDSIVSSFGEETEIDTDKIDLLKRRINDLERGISESQNTINRLSLDYENNRSIISYCINTISSYQTLLKEIKPKYKYLKDKLDSIISLDSTNINIKM